MSKLLVPVSRFALLASLFLLSDYLVGCGEGRSTPANQGVESDATPEPEADGAPSIQDGDVIDGETSVEEDIEIASPAPAEPTQPSGIDDISASTNACPPIPRWECTERASCQRLGAFLPRNGPGYLVYPKNGENGVDPRSPLYFYRSYSRHDLARLVRYAAASTLCLTREWGSGIGGPLGLGDMSEKSGALPGTQVGDPAHPAGSHIHGKDMDIAYFQKTSSDNKMRPVCPYGNHHCTGAPNNLDVERTAIFVAKLHDNPDLRIIGVDGKIGPLLKTKITQFCGSGLLRGEACRELKLAFETTNTGRGWFYNHHHHLHVSMRQTVSQNALGLVDKDRPEQACIVEGCRNP